MGIEPISSAWKAEVITTIPIPRGYTMSIKLNNVKEARVLQVASTSYAMLGTY